jgi:tetratricopeptide (TPR) repeat protein
MKESNFLTVKRFSTKSCVVFILIFFSLLLSCGREEQTYLAELQAMERGEYREQSLSQERVEELLEAIREYKKEVERKVDASSQIGVYYKMLAVQYMRAAMYQEAYQSLEQARDIYPENPVLFYLSGICAARLAKAQVEGETRALWFERAEFFYRRAIELDQLYVDALYALSVLYVFEFQQPQRAESLLERLLTKEKKNVDALFLLGNVYYQTGRLESALEVYDAIINTTSVETKKQEAEGNRQKIEAELYGK